MSAIWVTTTYFRINSWEIKLICVCLRGKSVAFVEILMAVRITICWAAVTRWRLALQTLETRGKFDLAVLTLFRWVTSRPELECFIRASQNIETWNDLRLHILICMQVLSQCSTDMVKLVTVEQSCRVLTSTIFRECNVVVGNTYTQ